MDPKQAEELAKEFVTRQAGWQEREELAVEQGKRVPWFPFLCRLGLHKWRARESAFWGDPPKEFRCERCLRVHGRWVER